MNNCIKIKLKIMKKSYLNFWKSMGFVLIISMVVFSMPKTVLAQGSANLFIEVDFMKVKPGEEGNYVELEQSVWKPLHQDRINKGVIVGWILYQLMYTGAADAYNFATVNVYANPDHLEDPYKGVNFEKVHPGKDLKKEFEKTLNARVLVKKQLMSRASYANPDGGGNPGPHKYIVVNYMKTIPGGNFLNLENEIAKPVSQELIKNGSWTGWSVWSNVFPRGTGMESDVVTVDNYADFSKIGSLNYRQAFEKAHPGKDWSEFTTKIGSSRNMVRSELWKVIDSVYAGQ
jgi:hypothetical protein